MIFENQKKKDDEIKKRYCDFMLFYNNMIEKDKERKDLMEQEEDERINLEEAYWEKIFGLEYWTGLVKSQEKKFTNQQNMDCEKDYEKLLKERDFENILKEHDKLNQKWNNFRCWDLMEQEEYERVELELEESWLEIEISSKFKQKSTIKTQQNIFEKVKKKHQPLHKKILMLFNFILLFIVFFFFLAIFYNKW
jgi:hypothetical protein